MSRIQLVLALVVASSSQGVLAQEPPFTGKWSIDLRTPDQRARGEDCGAATFELKQAGERVTGEHSLATVRCGRLKEGTCNSVQGVATGRQAILSVTSCRNGAIVIGKAERRGRNLHWRIVAEVKPGGPEGDSPLILGEGTLLMDSAKLPRHEP